MPVSAATWCGRRPGRMVARVGLRPHGVSAGIGNEARRDTGSVLHPTEKIEEDVFKILNCEGSIKSRNHVGGTSPDQVLNAIKTAKLKWQAF